MCAESTGSSSLAARVLRGLRATPAYMWLIVLAAVAAGCAFGPCRQNTAERDVMEGAESIRIERGHSRVCLLLHGFGSSPADFGRLPAALDEAGWDVCVPRLPGHGTSPDALRQVSPARLRKAARERYNELRSRYETVALGGFSMGGCLATGIAAERPPHSLVLVNPFFAVTYRWYYVFPVEWYLPVASPLLDAVPAQKSVNRPEGKKDIVAYETYPLEAVNMLMDLRDTILADLDDGALQCPVLLVYSAGDSVASPAETGEVLDRVTGGDYRTRRFTRSNHHVLHDYDREEVVRCIVDWLAEDTSRQHEEGRP